MNAIESVFAAMREGQPYEARDLAAATGKPLPSVRRVLRLLHRLGLVERRQEKKTIHWQTRQMDLPYL